MPTLQQLQRAGFEGPTQGVGRRFRVYEKYNPNGDPDEILWDSVTKRIYRVPQEVNDVPDGYRILEQIAEDILQDEVNEELVTAGRLTTNQRNRVRRRWSKDLQQRVLPQ